MKSINRYQMKQALLLILAILISGTTMSAAEKTYPASDWEDQYNPLASPDAEIGGKLSAFASQYPKSFNYYLDNNVFNARLFSLLFESLLTNNPLTLAHEPGLAAQWTVSDDKMTFTFKLSENAHWSDGKPITALDVKWTYDAIMKPENLTGPHKVALEKFDTPEILDERTIRFKAKEVHWRNLLSLGGFEILPKHIFEDQDFNKINFEFPVASGLYRLGEVKEGQYVRLERRDDWWNREGKRAQGTGNFQTLEFRFYAERETAYEAYKKGAIDFFAVYTSHRWVQQTNGERFMRNHIVKQQVYNYNPVGFQGFAMNMRREPFDDLKVRKALAHLLDREKMNANLMHNQYFLHKSYYEDLYDREHPNPNALILFDKEAARHLLKGAGWEANPKTGFLEKEGKSFLIKFLTRSASSDKFLVIYKEDLKDVGIDLVIDKKDWAAWARDMDEYNYDMTWAAWGAGIWKDPESMWHSKEANRPSGNNITGFKDPRVDSLIDQQRAIFDIEKRNAIVREVDSIVYSQVPYILLWYINYTRLLYWNKFGMPDTILNKYGNEQAAYSYWWVDPDSEADLEEAISSGQALPSKPFKVVFDDAFEGSEK